MVQRHFGLALAAATVTLGLAPLAHAAYLQFNSTSSTDWSTPGNWAGGGTVPVNGDVAAIFTTAVIDGNDDVTGINAPGQIAIGVNGLTSVLTINNPNDTTYITKAVHPSNSSQNNSGALTLDASNASTAGSATVNVASNFSIAGPIQIGAKNTGQTAGTATLNISGGATTADNMTTAVTPASNGVYTVNVSGGSLAVTNYINLSTNAAATSNFNISNNATVSANEINVGADGSKVATFSITGGQADISTVNPFRVRPNSTLVFNFDSGGISAIDVGGTFTFDAATSNLIINGNGFNTPGIYDLVNAVGLSSTTLPSNLTISGFGAYITEANFILDNATDDGNGRGWRLELVPEPSSLALIGLGAGLLATRRRRNRQSVC